MTRKNKGSAGGTVCSICGKKFPHEKLIEKKNGFVCFTCASQIVDLIEDNEI